MNADHIKYYEQRAKGGTGFIIVEATCVDFPLGSAEQHRLDLIMTSLFHHEVNL